MSGLFANICLQTMFTNICLRTMFTNICLQTMFTNICLQTMFTNICLQTMFTNICLQTMFTNICLQTFVYKQCLQTFVYEHLLTNICLRTFVYKQCLQTFIKRVQVLVCCFTISWKSFLSSYTSTFFAIASQNHLDACSFRPLAHRTLLAIRLQRDNDTIDTTRYGPCKVEAIHVDYTHCFRMNMSSDEDDILVV
jgi:hypothetical protein